MATVYFQDLLGNRLTVDNPASSVSVVNNVWDPNTLAWVKETQAGGGGGGTQYADGVTQTTPTGTVAMGKNPSNVIKALSLDSSGNLNINLAAGTVSGNAAASLTGSAAPSYAGYTGWNSAGNLVGVSLTNGMPIQPGTGATFPVSGTFWQSTQPVSIATMPTTPTNITQVLGAALSVTNPVLVEQVGLYYPNSLGNNTSAQLSSGAKFTGTVETILSLQAAQIEVVCDQPYVVTVYQYIDAAGTQLSSTDVFTRLAGQPLNENMTLPGNYFNLTLQNLGQATTTTLNINTTFGIMATGPRANSNQGNFKVALTEVAASIQGYNSKDYDLPDPALTNATGSVNQTGISQVESFSKMFDGTYWHRMQGSMDKGTFTYDRAVAELLGQILNELVVHTVIMQQAYNLTEDMKTLRNDPNLLN